MEEPFFHMNKESALPMSNCAFEKATVPVFDGTPSGKPMEDFMAVAKG
jgi:hypothetical protein